MHNSNKTYGFANFCWDAWCCLSLVGIWPRFIEHRCLKVTNLSLPIKNLSEDLSKIKIVQFSDLHLYKDVSDKFLHKLQKKILACKPDLILFTGDFICFSELNEERRLKEFFTGLTAPLGCYCILGNHDYDQFISLNESGEYDVLDRSTGSFKNIFKRLFTTVTLSYKTTEKAKKVSHHQSLENLIQETGFHLLKNETIQIQVGNSALNITGLEEYITGKCDPQKAFLNYKKEFPGIALLHNPDGFPLTIKTPVDIVLSGHTHGGQVNLPWLWKKFTVMEHPEWKNGLFPLHDKWLYVNRGVGSVIPFRWFAMPEILLLTLERKK